MDRYELNETMSQIREHADITLIAGGGQYQDQFNDVLCAHNLNEDSYFLAMDMFMLGMMCGRNEERNTVAQVKQGRCKGTEAITSYKNILIEMIDDCEETEWMMKMCSLSMCHRMKKR